MTKKVEGSGVKHVHWRVKMDIAQHLSDTREAIMEERPQMTVLAREVSEKFGCHVSPRVLSEICEAVKLDWTPKVLTGRHGSRRIDDLAVNVADLVARVDSLLCENAMLRRALQQLYRDCGVVPHPSLRWGTDKHTLPTVDWPAQPADNGEVKK